MKTFLRIAMAIMLIVISIQHIRLTYKYKLFGRIVADQAKNLAVCTAMNEKLYKEKEIRVRKIITLEHIIGD